MELENWYLIKDISEISEVLDQQTFINKTLVMTTLAMLLESFGHFLITFLTSVGYTIYFMEPRLILALIHLSVWSDVGGIFAGKFFGRDPFASSISPSKTVQGVYGALGLPVFVSIIFYIIG